MRILAFLIVVLGLAGTACAADPKDAIKDYKFEVRPVEYKGATTVDPFSAGVPIKAVEEEQAGWRVRIGTLKLSSVISGRQKVAIFKEAHGPMFSYILVKGVLLGPDHKAIPGVEGTIEELRKGEYQVTLKQGSETTVHTLADESLAGRRNAARGATEPASQGGGH